MTNEEPPTEAESFAYIQILDESRRPHATRSGSGLLMWLLVFATFAFLSGAVYQASAGAQSPALNVCIEKLTAGINPALMSKTTARRKARTICNGLRRGAPQFFKALTQ